MKKTILLATALCTATWLIAGHKETEEMVNTPIEQSQDVEQKAVKVEDVTNIAPEALLQTILAPHKGKVVLVDIWNTWCPPCRNSIKLNEPYKTGELADDNLVWIYIANETSPLETYHAMIPNIKGIHYRVNDAQWKYITKTMFNIDGIPSYVLVDKDGKYALRNDFRNHTLMVNTLKEQLKTIK